MEMRTCKKCGLKKEEWEFESGTQIKSGRICYRSWCCECERSRGRARKDQKAYNAQFHRMRKYGLTTGHYELMLKKQDNKCAICRCELIDVIVDHDHKTHKVRGLLCRKCNSGIGMLNDNLETLRVATAYLEKSNATTPTS